jgi:diguanylate cyclase (GGDEF)-like protein
MGGDEFVVILKGKDLERHRALIERMDSTFSDAYVTVHDESVSVSIARGVAVFSADIDRVYTDVFAKADQAMYMNKESMKLVRS